MNSYPFIVEKYVHPIITLDLAKSWLEMDIEGYEGKDELIEEVIRSAVSSVETQCNFQLGISTYEWNVNYRPCGFRDTFYVRSIESISFKGGDNPGIDGRTIIDPLNYELVRISKRQTIIEWNEFNFPYQTDYTGRLKIIFKAGFPEGDVPKDIEKAIRARIGEDYAGGGGDGVSEKHTLSDKLLAPYTIGYAG